MHILTFDVEEWFHLGFKPDSHLWHSYEVRIHENVDRILDTLQKHNRKGTFFILGWIAEKYPEVIKKIAGHGHELGCHSMNHELVTRLTAVAFKEDTHRALCTIEDVCGHKINAYRAPGFSITEKTPWAFEILYGLGITYDASVFPSYHSHGGYYGFPNSGPVKITFNNCVIKEFPLNTLSVYKKPFVFSGGGYFRLFPYPLLHKWTKASPYVMLYFHPRDFDSKQPVLKNHSRFQKFRSYYGLKSAHEKFDKWLDNFETVSLAQASDAVNWDTAPCVAINADV